MKHQNNENLNLDNRLEVSVVVPVYNEADNVAPLSRTIKNVFSEMNVSFEIIFVDDGSSDGTVAALKAIKTEIPEMQVVVFRNNFGQSAALAAGFDRARGDVIITMDGDLQNDPRDIPNILKKLDEGYDMVSGWRKKRHDTFLIRRIPSMIANRLICKVTGVKLHDTGCALKAYRRQIIDRINLYGELHRFIPALSKMEGAEIAELVVRHHPRRFGKSKYNLTRTFRVMLDLMTLNMFMKYLQNPVRYFGTLGLLLGVFGVVCMGFALLGFHFTVENFDKINVLITMAFLLSAAGVQLIFLGLLAKLIVETGVRQHDYFFDTPIMNNSGE